MVRRAAGDELHARDPFRTEAVQIEVREPTEERLVDRLRGLVDFLQHEVLEPALFRVFEGPCDPLRLAGHRVPFEVLQRDAFRRDDDHLLVHHVHDAVRVPQERRHVRCKEILVRPDSDHEGAFVPRADHLPRFVRVNREDRVRAADVVERLANRGLQIAVVIGLDQMDEALRVRLGRERVSAGFELLPQARVVLDDPVVRERDLPGAVHVRMRVDLRRCAVGRPTRVREPGRALQWRELRLEVRDEPFVFHDL